MLDLPLVLDDLDDVVAQVKMGLLAEPAVLPTMVFVYHGGRAGAPG